MHFENNFGTTFMLRVVNYIFFKTEKKKFLYLIELSH